jgi:glycosyltransferase involved in cell wall biosynthesis
MVISVCVLTKNEELSIKECLESVKNIADEIIILDSFSVDKTTEIAQQYTDKIFTHNWIDDFSYSRNLCISKALGEWVLIIDADETFEFSKNFKQSLINEKCEAFVVIRKENYRLPDDNKKVSCPVGIIRLFKNKKEVKFSHPIHERLDDYFIENNIPIGIAQNCFLIHNISNSSDVKVKAKQTYYLNLINKQLNLDKNNFWMIFQRAKTNFFFEKFDEVQTDLMYLIENKEVNNKIKVASIALLSLIYNCQNKYNQTIKLLQKELYKNKNTLYFCFIGDAYFKKKKYIPSLFYYLNIKTNTKDLNYLNCMYLMSYIEKRDKIYKIASSIYSLGYLRISKFILLLKKNELGADSFYLLSLIYHKQGKIKHSKYYIRKSLALDADWKTSNYWYEKLKYRNPNG